MTINLVQYIVSLHLFVSEARVLDFGITLPSPPQTYSAKKLHTFRWIQNSQTLLGQAVFTDRDRVPETKAIPLRRVRH